ncbi:hypothetical protein CYY_007650 [Polysphondylium violaceum]|uniref:Uncharacterized protein n=1 Tax=Polysphondylium violaceum TaxID=133409 RepID=A0A8J4PRL4_9MYCE|nr:hypothetical protein CYY_007650 [Polysphondylium violaceum]
MSNLGKDLTTLLQQQRSSDKPRNRVQVSSFTTNDPRLQWPELGKEGIEIKSNEIDKWLAGTTREEQERRNIFVPKGL